VTNYARMYRFGITPWERYRTTATASISTLLDREEAERSRPFGRAPDLGCGRWSEAHRRREVETAFAGWEMLAVEPAARRTWAGR
jgi:hypothetical protein